MNTIAIITVKEIKQFDITILIILGVATILLCVYIINRIIKLREDSKLEREESKLQCQKGNDFFRELCTPYINEWLEDDSNPPNHEHVFLVFYACGIILNYRSGIGNEIISTRKTIKIITAIWEPEGIRVQLNMLDSSWEEVKSHKDFAEQFAKILKNEYVICVPSIFERSAS